MKKFNKILKGTVDIMGKISVNGATALKTGAEKLYTVAKEDKAKLNEIEKINTLCQNLVTQFNKDKEKLDLEFEHEHTEYTKLIERINVQFEILNALPMLKHDTKSDIKQKINTGKVKDLSGNIEDSFSFENMFAYKEGGAAGVAVGIGTVGIMTAFGSAGTGAALSSLTGSAYINATLAALGGGTLAHGGLGILGGVAVLGTAVIAPALAVTGYITDKKINDAYKDALKRKEEIEKFKTESKKFLMGYNNGFQIFHHINRELYSFVNFFEELVRMSVAAPAIKGENKYIKLLNHAAKTILLYEQLNFINNDGSFNDNVKTAINKVKSEDNLCREEFYTYRAELIPEHQNLLNELRQQKILNDKLQTEIDWQKNNQPQNYIVRNRTIRNEFNKALQIATEELDIISAWINFNVVNENLQQSFENLLRRGVTIKILYGIGDMGLFTNDSRNRRTNEVVAHLKARFSCYPNFKMKCTNTHDKLFICDEKFYVHSSMNILSFSAEYNNNDVREEGGEASNNLQLIREYRHSLFNF